MIIMRRLFIIMALFALCFVRTSAQTIVEPENKKNFFREWHDGDEWAYIAQDGFLVGMTNQYIKDNYGKFYQIKVVIQNFTGEKYTFDPDSVTAIIEKKSGALQEMTVYNADEFRKFVKRKQDLAMILYGVAAGMNAGMDGYQTSTASVYGSGGYQTVTVNTYNHATAAMANTMAIGQMMQMDERMRTDRKVRNEGYLKKNTIYPDDGICGYMNIKKLRGKSVQVVVPILGHDFVFNWDLTNEKKTMKKL